MFILKIYANHFLARVNNLYIYVTSGFSDFFFVQHSLLALYISCLRLVFFSCYCCYIIWPHFYLHFAKICTFNCNLYATTTTSVYITSTHIYHIQTYIYTHIPLYSCTYKCQCLPFAHQ